MSSTRSTVLALPALAALAFAACGYPTFTFDGTGGGSTTEITGTTTTTTSTASAGGGGAGGETTTTSTSSTTTGTGGTGGSCEIKHEGGGPCEYLPGSECGCEVNEKCGVDDEATGATKCVLIGPSPLPVWSKCSTDSDCAAGTFCDHQNSVCKPICNNAGECGKGQCIPAIKKGTVSTEIPSLKLCTAHCNPETGAPCGNNLTCYYDISGTEFDCITTPKLGAGATCMYADDCDKGLVCVGSGNVSTCRHWCHPPDDIFPSLDCVMFGEGKNYCLAVDVQVQYEGATYGICSP